MNCEEKNKIFLYIFYKYKKKNKNYSMHDYNYVCLKLCNQRNKKSSFTDIKYH